MKYRIIKYGKEERENLLKKDNFRKNCCNLSHHTISRVNETLKIYK